LADPSINPETGKRLIQGKGPYLEYIRLCEKYGMIPAHPSLKMPKRSKITRSNQPSRQITKSAGPKIKSPRKIPKKQNTSKFDKIDSDVPYIRPKDLPEGFTGVEELDRNILRNLPVKSVDKLKFISSWIHKLVNGRDFLDTYARKYGSCPWITFENFDELHDHYNMKRKSKEAYIYQCLDYVSDEPLDDILKYSEEETIKTINVLDYLINHLTAKKSKVDTRALLYKVLNKYHELHGHTRLKERLLTTINNLAMIGNLDLLNDVISKYDKILYQDDPHYYNVQGSSPYIEMADGALVGEQKDILKLALEEIIEIDRVNRTNILPNLLRDIFSQYKKYPKRLGWLREVLQELNIEIPQL
jgi:hypothetical protein